VLNAAARFLEVRSRSVDEVRRHLIRVGYRPELVEGAVTRLADLGMLDDAAFARMWVESRDRARPRSESALRRELAQKGIERDLAAEVLDERRSGGPGGANGAGGAGGLDGDTADGPDMLAAERLLRRKASALARVSDPRERRQRAYGLLARNGFDPDVCREATIRFLAGGSEGPEA
jgi:SOS response regulatory protein OraA/RecX